MIKTANFNLSDRKNYNKNFKKKQSFYVREYIVLMKEFIEYFDKFIEYNNEKKYYIVFKGLQSIKHIFLMVLLYTKNLSLTLYHCKKSFLYYVEFISQIGDEGNSYLQLNSKDAILFIYKKSIFELNNDYRSNMELDTNDKDIMNEIRKLTKIFEDLYFHLIYKIVCNKEEKKEKIYNNIIKLFGVIEKKRENDEYLFDKINILVDFLNNSNIDNKKYLDIMKLILKKKSFFNINIIDFNNTLKKEKSNIYLNCDTYKGFINFITKQ
jgi:hypothetical protein